MGMRTELCVHGPRSSACQSQGCGYAHKLADLQIGPMYQGDRYERGAFCRYIGQTMSAQSHRLIMKYFDHEFSNGFTSPAWAHCYVWGQRQWSMGYRGDLGDFGIRQDYDNLCL